MRKTFFVRIVDGVARSYGDCFDEDPILQEPNVIEAPFFFDPALHYITETIVREYTAAQVAAKASPPPTPFSTWDDATMSWQDKRTVEDMRNAKRAEIGGGKWFKADTETRNLLFQKSQIGMMAIQDNLPFDLDWEEADGKKTKLSITQVKILCRAIDDRSGLVKAKLASYRGRIQAAGTPAAVHAIVWQYP
jgi:hypothetical protein